MPKPTPAEKALRRREGKSPKGLHVPVILARIQSGELDPARLSSEAKQAVAGLLGQEGYGSGEIAVVLKTPLRTVQHWRERYNELLAERLRAHAHAIVGSLVGTAASVKARLRAKGLWEELWRVEAECFDRLVRVGVVESAPERMLVGPMSLEEAFERLGSGQPLVDAESRVLPGRVDRPDGGPVPPAQEAGASVVDADAVKREPGGGYPLDVDGP